MRADQALRPINRRGSPWGGVGLVQPYQRRGFAMASTTAIDAPYGRQAAIGQMPQAITNALAVLPKVCTPYPPQSSLPLMIDGISQDGFTPRSSACSNM